MEKKIINQSHNCYWLENPIGDSILKDCKMFEVDIVQTFGKIILSHSWRPFPCMGYGKLDNFVNKLYKICKLNETTFYLYIEFKGKIDSKRLYQILKDKPDNLIICISAMYSKCYHARRHTSMVKFFSKYSDKLNIFTMGFMESTYNIIKHKLYDKKWWMF